MCIIDPLVTHPSPHLGALACPSTSKMLQTRERTPTSHPSDVFTLDSQLSLSRSLRVRQLVYIPLLKVEDNLLIL